MAKESADDFIKNTATFTYTEASGSGATAVPAVNLTVAQLMLKVAELEAEIASLK
jgi:hypothetical protein